MRPTVKRLISASAALFVAGSLVAAAPAAKRHARLTVLDQSPLVVRGAGFLPRERVTLEATAGDQQAAKVVRARVTGVFTARFDAITDASCSPFTVTAAGARGTTAASRRLRIPEACGIVIQP